MHDEDERGEESRVGERKGATAQVRPVCAERLGDRELLAQLLERGAARAEAAKGRRGLVKATLDRPNVRIVQAAEHFGLSARGEIGGPHAHSAVLVLLEQVATDRVRLPHHCVVIDQQRHLPLRIKRQVLLAAQAANVHRRHDIDCALETELVHQHAHARTVVGHWPATYMPRRKILVSAEL
jgi:hypothetical protein